MESQNFRQLDIDLPRQPLSDQRPWLIAGLVLGLTILVIALCAYLEHSKHAVSPKLNSSYFIPVKKLQ